jgi:hypothetical protein
MLYGPALYQSDIAYLPKPLSSDKKHLASYLSAAFIQGNGPDPDNFEDEVTRGEVNFGQGLTLKNFNIAYSVFGAAGNYDNQSNYSNLGTTKEYYFTNKFFGAAGGRFSANAYITSGRVDIRFIGFEMAYSHEFGDYADYRKMVTSQPYFYTNTRTDLVTLGGTSEVIWHSSDPDIQFGLRLFIGSSLNGNYYKNQGNPAPFYNGDTGTGSLAYFMQIHRYFFVGELNSTGGQFRIGLRF